MTDHQQNKLMMAVRYCRDRDTIGARKLPDGILKEDYATLSNEEKLCLYDHIKHYRGKWWAPLIIKLRDELLDKDVIK